jgi:hypothetical protein
MVPKLVARDPWNDSAAACKANAAENDPKGVIGRHSRR